MDIIQVESASKQEMDDSGCVQDDMQSPIYKKGYREIGLLDLSDDVLLYILKRCSPQDLKALGFTCERLGTLVLERSLWRHVDARCSPLTVEGLKWHLDHTLHDETKALLITGHAAESAGCLGLINTSRSVAEDDLKGQKTNTDIQNGGITGSTIAEDNISVMRELPQEMRRLHARYHVTPQRVVCLARIRGCPAWGDERDVGRAGPQQCVGPRFNVTPDILKRLATQCSGLTELSLEYCNINCNHINLSQFPSSIKKLSLRGTKFFNLMIDRSFLSNINEHLPVLEYLDLSECEWMEPSSLLPLSKHTTLTHLIVRECYRLTEFVAYASLTTRYGFRNLKVIDMRGSPVGDSEVSALGWLPTLEELYLSAARRVPAARHAHYADDECVPREALASWERAEPEYFKLKSNSESEVDDTPTTASTEPSTSHEFSTYRPIGRTLSHMVIKHRRNDNSDDACCPPKKRKLQSDCDENDGNPKDPVHIQMPNNVIIVSGIRNQNCRQTEPVYCNCPQHGVEKTDKATETDNDMFKCSCQGASSSSNSEKLVQNDKEMAVDDHDDDEKEKHDDVTAENDNKRQKIDNSENSSKNVGTQSDGPKYVHFRRNQKPVFVNCAPSLPGTSRQELGGSNSNGDNAGATGKKYSEFMNAIARYWGSKDENKDENNDSNENIEKDKPGPSNESLPGASTSKDSKEPSTNEKECKQKDAEPEITVKVISCQRNLDQHGLNDQHDQEERQNDQQPLPTREQRRDVQYIVEPRHHVLYVSVGSQLNTYRFPRDPFENDRNYLESHIDSSSLVTDFAIRRFGRADGEDVNYVVNFGPNGPVLMGNVANSRADRSNLRVLSVTGYRNITDRSLTHLVSAAPRLRLIDFSNTNVSEQGVENFKSLRPECEIVFSKFIEKKD